MRQQLQVLEEGHWIDVDTRCKSEKGMKRLYQRLYRENEQNVRNGGPIVAGMRIITIQYEHLGYLVV